MSWGRLAQGAWRIYRRQPKVPGPLSDYLIDRAIRWRTKGEGDVMPYGRPYAYRSRRFTPRYPRRRFRRTRLLRGYRPRGAMIRRRRRAYTPGFGWAFMNR